MALFLLVSLAVIAGAGFLFLRLRNPVFVLRRYDYAVVTRKDITSTAQFPGIIDFSTTATLSAPAGGSVESISAEAGTSVKKGQILLQLRSPQAELALQSDSDLLSRKRLDRERLIIERSKEVDKNGRDLEAAAAQSRRAEEAASRVGKLIAAGFAAQADLDAAETARADAARQLAEVQSRIRWSAAEHGVALASSDQDIAEAQAQVMRDRDLGNSLTVRSPFDGKVIQVVARPGALLDARAPLLTLIDQSSPVVKIQIPERQVGMLAPGQAVTITVGTGRFEGRIAAMDARATGGSETTTSTVAVTVTFLHPPADLLPGISASAELTLGSQAGALTLPRGPFLTTGGDAAVYVISGDRAEKTVVAWGVQSAAEVEAARGVTEGQKVIVSSYQDFNTMDSVMIDPQEGRER